MAMRAALTALTAPKAFRSMHLHEPSHGITGHAQVVFHADFGGVLDLIVSSVESRNQAACGHRTSDTNLTLAADLRSRDRGILLVEDADRGGGEEEAYDSLVVSVETAQIILGDRRNYASRTIRGRGDDATTRGVFFVDRHSPDIQPVHRRQFVPAV
jgi:hypothetical protein